MIWGVRHRARKLGLIQNISPVVTIYNYAMLKSMPHKPQLIVICGPTATGKSDLAVAVALHLHRKAEILSADSRQVYTYLNLGTGKITPIEMKSITHHLLDVVTPDKTYTVDQFKKDGNNAIKHVLENKHLPIICGGTGLYIDTLVHNIELPDVEADEKLRAELEEKTLEELLKIFSDLNKDQPHKVDLKNKRKVIRAIEILTSLGHIPVLKKDEIYDVLYIGLDTSDETLKDKIRKRIDARLEQGMIKESEHLLSLGLITHERMQTLGLEYKFISDLLKKEITLAEFKEKLFFGIWHYAKRQRTWFKKNEPIHWLDAHDTELQEKVFSLVDNFIK